MLSPTVRVSLSFSAFTATFGIAALAVAEPTGTSLHDPSRMIESNGKVFVYVTEGQGGDFVSSDGLAWQRLAAPPFNPNLLSGNQGVWAPDGIFLNGQYLIYYAMWSSSKQSALALLTSPSLDPAASNYKWTDRGIVIHSPASPTYSMIDPCPVLDAQGNLWVSWGGGYPFNASDESLWVTRLDNATGLPLASDSVNSTPNPGHPIATGHREGSFLYYHAGYYYLFWQTGNGFNPGTSYQINMSRATTITGPYSGDQVFYSKNPGPGIYGPGHMGIYSCGGDERFTYHYYSNNTNAGSALGENTLTWGSNGWPVPGPVSATPLKLPCQKSTSSPGADGGGGISTDADASASDGTGTSADSSTGTPTSGSSGAGSTGTSGTGSAGSAGTGSTDTSGSAGTSTDSDSGATSGTNSIQGSPDASLANGGSSGDMSSPAEGGSSLTTGAQSGAGTNESGSSQGGCAAVGSSTSRGAWLEPVGLFGLLLALRRRRSVRRSSAA